MPRNNLRARYNAYPRLSTVCHHVKFRILTDESNNFVEMERVVLVTDFAKDWLIEVKYEKRDTNERKSSNLYITLKNK